MLGLWLAAFGASGCAAVGAQGPRDVLSRARVASREHNYPALYALLPESARRAESLAQFAARMRTQERELTEFGDAVEQSLRARSPAVDVPSREGGAATAVEDAGEGWRVGSSGLGDGAARTPAAALQGLRRALERGSLPALLRLLSSRARGALLADLAVLLDGVTDPAPLAANNLNQRELLLPDGRRLVLILENSQWRIHDLLEATESSR